MIRTKTEPSAGALQLEDDILVWRSEYKGDKSLFKFLGITWEEYVDFLLEEKLPRKYEI